MTVMAERPTTRGSESDSFKGLLRALDELDVPDGYKAEIIRGNIVVSPWSKGYYLDVMELVCDQLRGHLPAEHRISYGPFLFVFPGVERAYGPDIHVAHRGASRSASNHLDGEALSFVAELTSTSTRDDDLTDKVVAYGRAGVPVYLLLDMQEEQATVFSMPSAKGYESRDTKPFGEKLGIPAPFGCVLDTTGFTAP
ncbi:Uma2 family endonuclease [Streptomyces sp. NPDC012461]|jgi:Uma2 family endonuclease|uniref:Uma2 family endonuclease n=2 Tax=unclassified Streptomyces TaxID=2593676 RepID=A0A6G3R062_9ACTN|nr:MULTISPECIES: Uma2 family endonuclease [unclassified Streptomyces]MBM7089871.1 Uma2 family endonuclease [Streptomyces sp. S12]NEA89129.1 Uma2 family endonuclease [Streptomyces sp. SID14436]NEC82502.1 Uma2 family endonuclease [Streptomyces sp. SID7958]NED19591.1 Uma2 family endonuclease [Streptomyces sp. SID9913]